MTFSKQERTYSCGCASLRNCLKSMGEIHSERKIRDLSGASKNNGVSDKQLITAISALGHNSKKFMNLNERAFKNRITRELKNGNKVILLTDHEEHWVSLIDYEFRKVSVIDSQKGRRLKHILSLKDLSVWALNFNKRTRVKYYFGLVIYPISKN